MKDSEVLRMARNKLKKYKFICRAIKSVRASEAQKIALIQWIENMLQGQNTYGAWLAQNHTEIYQQYLDLSPGRLAWLDWMIDYCEKEEANGN